MTVSAKEQKPYSMNEQMILAKMETLMNGKPFHYVDIDTTIRQNDRQRRKEIISDLTALCTDIRLKKKEKSALFEYQNVHFDEPDYAWLQEQHPGVNINGWRVVMVLMDPLKYGYNVDRPVDRVHSKFVSGRQKQ